jgi:hypothetical protein
MALLCPWRARLARGGAGAEQTQDVYIPLKTAPGLGPPRPWDGARIQLSYKLPNDKLMLNRLLQLIWWGPDWAGPPREGGDPYCLSPY